LSRLQGKVKHRNLEWKVGVRGQGRGGQKKEKITRPRWWNLKEKRGGEEMPKKLRNLRTKDSPAAICVGGEERKEKARESPGGKE